MVNAGTVLFKEDRPFLFIKMLLFTIFVIGLSGIVSQMIILRELLVNFYGNELTIGIILANWVILEAVGAFTLGRLIEKIKNKLNVFISLNILFALILPFCVYFSRTFKEISGIPFIGAVSLSTIFFSSFIIILPTAFLHGALFSCGCKVYSLAGNQERSIGSVYTWETLGTIIGGVLLAFVLVPFINSFQIVFIISLLNLFLSLSLVSARKVKLFCLAGLTLLAILFFIPSTNYLQKSSIQIQWQGQKVLDYRNSNYANIVVTKKLEQYTFFYNGLPVITTPFPDQQFVEEFAQFPLLFHNQPSRVLVAGSGIGGLIAEILKYPVTQVDYVEIDPLIIKMIQKYPTPLSEKELGDRRVKIINTDPRIFLRKNVKSYDVILLGLSNQSDLSSNRLFTQEFFTLAKQRLSANGLIALWMNGSLTYLSPELKDLHNCILNSLKSVYRYVRVIPGDRNIFIASDNDRILSVSAESLSERLARNNISVSLLIPDYLKYRLSQDKLDWFNLQMAKATRETNRDLRPVAVYETLKITNKKFSPRFSRFFDYLNYLNLKLILLAIFLATAVLMFIYRRTGYRKIPLVYAIFTTGFFGMLASLLLIFAYQIFYGYLYQKISVLTAVFMAGIAAGSAIMVSALKRVRATKALFIGLEGAIVLFSLILAAAISSSSTLVIYPLLFIAGLLMGMEFPLAGKLYLQEAPNRVGRASGLLYASDLFGGWLAGILAGVAFLPILGFFNTCMVMALLKLSSLILLCF